jgi:hypothetical protein
VLNLAWIPTFVGMTLGFRQAALGMHPELFGQPARISIKKAERGPSVVHERSCKKPRPQKMSWAKRLIDPSLSSVRSLGGMPV